MEIQEERVMFVLCTVSCWDLFLKRDYGHTKTDKIHRQLHTKYKRNAFCAAPGTRQVTQKLLAHSCGIHGGKLAKLQSHSITTSGSIREKTISYLRYASLGVCIADKASPLISIAIS